jgi:glycosyltransferase
VLQARRHGLAALISEPDEGIYSGLNKGLARACGDAVGLLHGDDVYADAEVLARVAEAPHPTLFLRRAVYERFGLFDTRYRIAADDDLMLRVLPQLSGRVVYLPQVLVRMRVGGASNRSLRQVVRKSWEDYRALRANRVGGLGALAWKNVSKLPQFVMRSSVRHG